MNRSNNVKIGNVFSLNNYYVQKDIEKNHNYLTYILYIEYF